MTPYSLAFFVDVVLSGTVLGARPTDSPERVAELLGEDFTQNQLYADAMWRDYGLVEFYWQRSTPDHPWEGHHFSVQVHRLAFGGADDVSERIRARYGRFDRRLHFEKLERLLLNRGVPMEEVPDVNNPEYTLHRPVGSPVSVMAARSHGWQQRPYRRRHVGEVIRISSQG